MNLQENPRPIEDPNIIKREVISKIAGNIEKEFPSRPRPKSREINRHTDDMYLFDIWPGVVKSLSETARTSEEELRVGLVVGAGGAPSTFPELLPELDLLVFADYDQRVLDWVKSTLQNLEKYPKSDLYERLVYSDSNPLLSERGSNYGSNIYTDEIESWGGFHFLDSDQRYKIARQSYIRSRDEGKRICYANLDLGDPTACVRLSEAFGNDAEIVYSNLTNLAVYISASAFSRGGRYKFVEETQTRYKDALRELPFSEGTIIQFSDIENRLDKPKADMTIGLESYLKKAVRKIPL